jgi:hypothetical protein
VDLIAFRVLQGVDSRDALGKGLGVIDRPLIARPESVACQAARALAFSPGAGWQERNNAGFCRLDDGRMTNRLHWNVRLSHLGALRPTRQRGSFVSMSSTTAKLGWLERCIVRRAGPEAQEAHSSRLRQGTTSMDKFYLVV